MVAAGCGEESGTAENAAVTVYASASSCVGAKRELESRGKRAGDVRVRVACLDDARVDGGLDLAAIGANARRATEDSTAVAYIAERDPAAARFSRPILAEAGIARLTARSGRVAMSKLLRALREASGSGSLRQSVADALR